MTRPTSAPDPNDTRGDRLAAEERARDLARAGNVIAEHLGLSLAAHAEGKNLSVEHLMNARQAILLWHLIATQLTRSSTDK